MKWVILGLFLASSVPVVQARFSNERYSDRDQSSPAIRNFAFSSFDPSSSQYTFLWDVRGARDGTVFLFADCVADTTIQSRVPDSSNREPFSCGVLHPLRGSHGTIDLSFSTDADQNAIESVRLFVAGSKVVCSTLSVPLMAGR